MSAPSVKMPARKPLKFICVLSELLGKAFLTAFCVLMIIGTSTGGHNWTAIIACAVAAIAFMVIDVFVEQANEQYAYDVITGQ